jgi:hypothetical protein
MTRMRHGITGPRAASPGGALRRGTVLPGATLAAALLVAALLAGCGVGRRMHPEETSALWLDASSAALDGAALAGLKTVGLEGLFGEAAALRWDGDRPRLEGRSSLKVPPRTPVTLVIRGSWKRGLDGEATGRALVEELRRVSL